MNLRETLKSKYSILVFIDVVMMVLLVANLSLILFDWVFVIPLVNGFFSNHTPDFYSYYTSNIHHNFHSIDMLFVAIFLGEFMLSWILAIIQKVYYKWFFYPIIHWYDLAGCIPVGSLRFLRILRVFSILVRLQNLKVIDLSNSYVIKKLKKYYGIVVEEISDRVVVNILEGVQDEISGGGQSMDTIITKVIRPRQDLIAEWISQRIEYVIDQEILSKKEEINMYVRQLMSESLKKNAELKTLEHIPVMGKLVVETIGNAISNIINNIIEQALADLSSHKNRIFVQEATDAVLNTLEYKDGELNDIFTSISLEVIDIIKDQVKVKKWRMKEEAENGSDETERGSIEFLMADN